MTASKTHDRPRPTFLRSATALTHCLESHAAHIQLNAPTARTGASNAPAIVASSRRFPRSSCLLAREEIHRQRPDRYLPDQSSQMILERNAPAKQETLGCARYRQ